jgi:hypothetical protein
MLFHDLWEMILTVIHNYQLKLLPYKKMSQLVVEAHYFTHAHIYKLEIDLNFPGKVTVTVRVLFLSVPYTFFT